VPPLLALDAEVELASQSGRRKLPLSQFLVGNRKTLRRTDEVLSAVIVPRGLDNAHSSFLKLGSRRYLVISMVMVAAIVDVDGEGKVKQGRVAVGSCSAVGQRLVELERHLAGVKAERGFTNAISPEHLSALSPIDDVRATADYRLDAALTLVKRALEACVEGR
jgi:CO/xanthine dehydrogenase FAD-binding subunit